MNSTGYCKEESKGKYKRVIISNYQEWQLVVGVLGV